MINRHALFVTTRTTEPIENVDAWRNTMGPAEHVTFDINGPRVDEEILDHASDVLPDIIFYTGGVSGAGIPSDKTLRALRGFAPSVIIQGDFADPPWHPVMAHYREAGCFDYYVAMDGVRLCPADYVTLTPFDVAKYDPPAGRTRDIRCGFGGNLMKRDYYDILIRDGQERDPRSDFMYSLDDVVTVRPRELDGNYAGYVDFMSRCEMVINTATAGSGLVSHVKGRVLEATFAGAAVLEPAGSPAREWFPRGSLFAYQDAADARTIIRSTPVEEMRRRAAVTRKYAVAHYHPAKIYGAILERLARR